MAVPVVYRVRPLCLLVVIIVRYTQIRSRVVLARKVKRVREVMCKW